MGTGRMGWEAAGLRRTDRIIWGLIAAVGVIVAIAALTTPFRVVWRSMEAPGAATLAFLAAQYVYETQLAEFRLAAGLGATAQLVAFAAVAAPLSYIAASLDLPLHDRWLNAVDTAAALDWPAWLNWMDAHAAIHPLFQVAYDSLLPQTALVVLVLAFTGRLMWLRTYMLAFVLTTIATIVVSAIVPAEGVWGFLNLGDASGLDIVPVVHGTYLPVFHGLRDGTFRLLMASGADGIITFPSLHAALGLLFIAALWPVPVLRWIALAFNIVMILSVPVDGGHYFVDIFAGLCIAGASLPVARAIIRGARFGAIGLIEPTLVPAE
ncbi:MAG: phosphatase PAP2 family protein [Pseudolabrys sp.]